MPRIKADPDATPEQNAARVIQNAATTFGERADRFTMILERYSEDLEPQAREHLETWVRQWAARLISSVEAGDRDTRLRLLPDSDDTPSL